MSCLGYSCSVVGIVEHGEIFFYRPTGVGNDLLFRFGVAFGKDEKRGEYAVVGLGDWR